MTFPSVAVKLDSSIFLRFTDEKTPHYVEWIVVRSQSPESAFGEMECTQAVTQSGSERGVDRPRPSP